MHLLKVDEPIHEARFITFICESHIFKQKWHERNNWGLEFANTQAIRPMVSTGIYKRFELCVQFTEFWR